MSALERVSNAVDGHHHFWSPKTHGWLDKVADGGHPAGPFRSVLQYEVEEYMKDAATANITKSVHVQAHYDGEPLAETRSLQSIAERTGFPHGIVAYADLSAPDVNSLLTEHCKYANVRGIRQMLDFHPTNEQWRQAPHDHLLTDDSWLTGLQLLPQNNLSFDIQLHVPQLQVASTVVRSNPNVQFILNHAGFPAILSDEAVKSWKEGLSALARHDNISIKLSGFNMFHHSWNKDLLRPLIEYSINTFSTDRCAFASNFPVDKINGTMADLFGAYFEICCDLGLNQNDVDKMFRDNATRLYRL